MTLKSLKRFFAGGLKLRLIVSIPIVAIPKKNGEQIEGRPDFKK
jgi:hypothetical protein